jgi:hypothetical protein
MAKLLYITQLYNQINFFIDGGDFDKCGDDIDGGDLTCILIK